MDVQVGRFYTVPSLSGKSRLTIRVRKILAVKSGYTQVLGQRLRPADPTVNFGSTHVYSARTAAYQEVAYPTGGTL